MSRIHVFPRRCGAEGVFCSIGCFLLVMPLLSLQIPSRSSETIVWMERMTNMPHTLSLVVVSLRIGDVPSTAGITMTGLPQVRRPDLPLRRVQSGKEIAPTTAEKRVSALSAILVTPIAMLLLLKVG